MDRRTAKPRSTGPDARGERLDRGEAESFVELHSSAIISGDGKRQFLIVHSAQSVGGRVMFDGKAVTGRPPHELARRGLVLVPERDKVFETLTVQENLRALVSGRADRGAERAPVTMEQVFHYFPVLAGRRRQLAASYLSVFIRTNQFNADPKYTGGRGATISPATNNTLKLNHLAQQLLVRCYKRGFRYWKVFHSC